MAHPAMAPALAPDFTIFTGAMEVESKAFGEELSGSGPIVSMVGSSTIQDIQRDTMQFSALEDMSKADLGLSIWLNHSYSLPDDLFGSLVRKPRIEITDGIADLYIAVEVETDNPPAQKTLSYIQRGRRLGCSVGCVVEDYSLDENDPFAGIQILHVRVVEWSVVGIPANQRSWVEGAIKGVFNRTLDERLAPAVKSLYPRDYERIVANIDDMSLRKQYDSIKARPQAGSLMWIPARKSFLLDTNGHRQEVSREAVGTALPRYQHEYLQKAFAAAAAAIPPTRQDLPPMTPDQTLSVQGVPEAVVVTDDEADVDITTKGATGKTSWPLADRDRSWDDGAAHKRLTEWAGGKDDLSVGKFRSVHFWSPSGDATKNVSDYKLAFCDVVNGKIMAIPRALFACAGGHGVNAASIPDTDKAAIRTKISTYYRKMRDEFGDDGLVAPWDTEKTVEEADIMPNATPSHQTDAASAPATTKADSVAVADDGSHAAFTGKHSHAHHAYGDQGDDAMHEHTHEHNNDSDHHHNHAEKAGTPETTPAILEPPLDPPHADILPPIDPLLASYNFIGSRLGLVALSADDVTVLRDAQVSQGKTAGLQHAVSTIAHLDTHAGQLTQQSESINQLIDMLLQQIGIGATIEVAEADPDDTRSADEIALEHLIRRVLQLEKSGREFSSANKGKLTDLHNGIAHLLGGDCCKGFLETFAANPPPKDDDDDEDNEPDDDEDDDDYGNGKKPSKSKAVFTESIRVMETLTRALASFDIEAVHSQTEEARAQIEQVKSMIRSSQEQAHALAEELDHVGNRGTGRPTRANASLNADPAAVQVIPELPNGTEPQTPEEAQALVKRQYVAGKGNCRFWPAGFARGIRPPLSSEAKSLMTVSDIMNYLEDGEAFVPEI